MRYKVSITISLIFLFFSSVLQAGKLAIVIDDFGYRPTIENQILNMPINISIAILPDAPHAHDMAMKAHQQGR